MPIYEFKCKCGKREDRFLEFENYKEPQTCICGNIMDKLISRPSNINMKGTRGITSRTDIEMETMSREQSMKELEKSNKEANENLKKEIIGV